MVSRALRARKKLSRFVGACALSNMPKCRFAATFALLGSLIAAPAQALIVVDGKIVDQWPDQPARGASAMRLPAGATHPIGFYPDPKGTVYGLTILVDFSDTPPAFSVEAIEAWLNEPGFSEDGVNGSVRDYFFDNSNGVVDFQNEVVGFHRASQPKSYYEGGNGYERAGELVDELMQALDGEVDFSQFDNDGDGRTEAISIVYAGQAEEWGQGLWPHAGGLNEQRDGVRLTRYQMTALGDRFALYVMVHEVGHMLFGWPDLYGFGNYCVMGNASNQSNPVGINDFYRADQGWIPLIDIDADTNARFYANVNAGGYRYVNPERPDEAFFWSNVQNTNRWSTLRGNGLVVLHFDGDIRSNDPPNPLSLAVVQADGLKELDATMWPEPGSEQPDFYVAGGNSELSGSTNPSSDWNDGSASGLRLYEVSESGESMTFAVGTGTPDPGIGGAGGAPTGGAAGSGAGGTTAGEGGMSGTTGGGAAGAGAMAGAGGTTGGSGGQPPVAGQAGVGTAGTGGSAGGAAGSVSGGTSGASGAMASGGTTTAGGAAGAAGSPVAGSSSGTAGSTSNAPVADEGCACRHAGTRPSSSALALLGAVVALGLRARRSRSRSRR
jgi:M6 family metalloprotease-like protein/MYXO-CTERM domain-containing protein